MYPYQCPYAPLCYLSQMTGVPMLYGGLTQPFHHGFEVRELPEDYVKEYRIRRKVI